MRILIGYDGSGGARAAIADLARAGLPVDARALVVSVADAVAPNATYDEATTCIREARPRSRTELDDANAWAEEGRRHVRDVEPSWTVECESRADSPAWTLLQRAETWRADLLVVGSTGRSALGTSVFGSVAEKLLHEVPCGIRIGRGRPASERPGAERLVVGVDGSPASNAAVATILARRWNPGSAVRVVTAVNHATLSAFAHFAAEHATPLSWLRTLNEVAVEKFAAAGLDSAAILAEGDAKAVLLEEAESWGADCIFLGAHGWHGMERELLGSVASAVAVRARCSVEVVRPVRTRNEAGGSRRISVLAAK